MPHPQVKLLQRQVLDTSGNTAGPLPTIRYSHFLHMLHALYESSPAQVTRSVATVESRVLGESPSCTSISFVTIFV